MISIQVLLTIVITISSLATCFFVIFYYEEKAKEQLAWSSSAKIKGKNKPKSSEMSIEETLMEILDLSPEEREAIELCEYEGKRPKPVQQMRKSFIDLTKKGTRLNILHLILISLVFFMVIALIGANNGSAPTAVLAVIVAIIYPFLIVNALSILKTSKKQYEAQLAMRTLMSTYMDAPNFDVAVKDALKTIKPGTDIHATLQGYYNAVFNEGVGKAEAMLSLKEELYDDYYFRMFILTAIKAETSKAEYKKTLMSIPRRYEMLVKENRELAGNLTIMIVIYALGLIALLASYPMSASMTEEANHILNQTVLGNAAQIAAFTIYTISGIYLLGNLKLVKVE